ncbi:hypothetical protein ASPBRDRAFT_424913 [Aspergillus brasiliensis CBS 101740]|uniref:Uncharacterized protein n=1 Tax=Aspergillus brasiliensis (strain CBS 101740 / IMI 381727 / IBT 21946) TaxID=767769 RepID=A0A1L9U3Q0_ASPBC|nr:hypothetical protein ASPBRDRAFT_424913 [Aspergillus brasiliensis CBS 101740]
MSHQLCDSAKSTLEEISAIIASIDNNPASEEQKAILSRTDGEVVYGTRLLVRKVSDLMRQMSFPQNSTITVTKFLKPSVILNEEIRKVTRYLIVLSEKALLNPGGEICYGHYIITHEEVEVDPGAIIIFITPKQG